MKLIITHHAFVRLGDWHPEYKGLVPTGKVTLNPDQANRMIAALGVLVWSMERGRPSTLLERVNETKRWKYGRQSFYLFDRESRDLFQLVRKDESTFALVTVTCMTGPMDSLKILDDPKPQFKFEDTTEIALPYLLNFESSRLDICSIITPCGTMIPISYGCKVFEEGN